MRRSFFVFFWLGSALDLLAYVSEFLRAVDLCQRCGLVGMHINSIEKHWISVCFRRLFSIQLPQPKGRRVIPWR